MSTVLWLRIAAVTTFLFAAGHALGALESWYPVGESPTLESMGTFSFDVMGRSRTYLDFYIGFGHYIGVLLVLQATLLWQFGPAAKQFDIRPSDDHNVDRERRRRRSHFNLYVHHSHRDVSGDGDLPRDRPAHSASAVTHCCSRATFGLRRRRTGQLCCRLCRSIDRPRFHFGVRSAVRKKAFQLGCRFEKDDTAVAVIRCKRCENMWQMQRKAGAAGRPRWRLPRAERASDREDVTRCLHQPTFAVTVR